MQKEINYLIFLVLLISAQPLSSQENKFGLTIEYSPNFSKLTDEVIDEKFKLSHNSLLRMTYQSKGKIKPTFGLGFLNTGELASSELSGTLGIESIKFIQNYTYIYIPIGAKINFKNLYILPELGVAINVSKTTKIVTDFSNGETEMETIEAVFNSGEFNKYGIPFSFSVGTKLTLNNLSFTTGLKGYYGLTQVVKNVPRNNHYFGIGLLLAMNFGI